MSILDRGEATLHTWSTGGRAATIPQHGDRRLPSTAAVEGRPIGRPTSGQDLVGSGAVINRSAYCSRQVGPQNQ